MTDRVESKKPPVTNRGVTGDKSELLLPSGSVDYFTCTCDDEDSGMRWLDIFNEHKIQAKELGYKVKGFTRHGYTCMVINSLTWGVNSKGSYMMVASGREAQLHWVKTLPSARSISRLDLAYTFQYEGDANKLIKQHYKDVENITARKYTYWEDSRGGALVYVGSRQSDQFGRVYNKSTESDLSTPNVIRYEVEFKKPRAFAVFSNLYTRMKRAEYQPDTIRDLVLSWFETRGVIAPTPSKKVVPIQLAVTLTSAQRKLNWLRTQVRPSIFELVGDGHKEAVIEALGLRKWDKEAFGTPTITQVGFMSGELDLEDDEQKSGSEK